MLAEEEEGNIEEDELRVVVVPFEDDEWEKADVKERDSLVLLDAVERSVVWPVAEANEALEDSIFLSMIPIGSFGDTLSGRMGLEKIRESFGRKKDTMVPPPALPTDPEDEAIGF